MNTAIVLALGLICGAVHFQSERQLSVKFELRRAETAPAAGLTEATVRNSKEKVYLRKEAVITGKDIVEVRVIPTQYDRTFEIDVVFTSEAARRMAIVTEEHIGRPMAIIFDGQVMSAPIINSKLSDRAQITGQFTKEEAERIAKGIKDN